MDFQNASEIFIEVACGVVQRVFSSSDISNVKITVIDYDLCDDGKEELSLEQKFPLHCKIYQREEKKNDSSDESFD